LAMALREIKEDGVDLDRLEVTTCLRGGELVTDVRHREGADDAAEALRAGLAERLGRFTYTETGEAIEEVVFRLLGEPTIAVGESWTGGLRDGRLTLKPGSSKWFAGGVVAYSNEAKAELLGVDPELIERHGAVSPEVAEAMADGAIERFDADVGVGVTGVA